jgi:hypothetical protein
MEPSAIRHALHSISQTEPVGCAEREAFDTYPRNRAIRSTAKRRSQANASIDMDQVHMRPRICSTSTLYVASLYLR